MLGEGAFGKVYSAVRKSDGLKVAIKEISKRKISIFKEELPLEVKYAHFSLMKYYHISYPTIKS